VTKGLVAGDHPQIAARSFLKCRVTLLQIMNFCRIFALAMVVSSGAARSQPWQPTAGHYQVPIWPGDVPDADAVSPPEDSRVRTDRPVAGRPWVTVERVSRPTITVYSPKDTSSGAAVIVFPGGGYKDLAIDLEGTEACDWLTSKGITCVLLKYRVPDSGPHWEARCDCQIVPKHPIALEDAQRAVGLVRFHAAEWNIDPKKVGVLGFSAGGHLAAAISTHFDKRLYGPVDAADKKSCRPDFAIALYPGHLSLADNSIALNPDIRAHVSKFTPPTFLLQNEDDDSDRVEDSLSYYVALKKATVPVEMHLYAQGGHAFGLRRTKYPASEWPSLVETWLGTLGIGLPSAPTSELNGGSGH
jgi:acetyl esterase/lipase